MLDLKSAASADSFGDLHSSVARAEFICHCSTCISAWLMGILFKKIALDCITSAHESHCFAFRMQQQGQWVGLKATACSHTHVNCCCIACPAVYRRIKFLGSAHGHEQCCSARPNMRVAWSRHLPARILSVLAPPAHCFSVFHLHNLWWTVTRSDQLLCCLSGDARACV